MSASVARQYLYEMKDRQPRIGSCTGATRSIPSISVVSMRSDCWQGQTRRRLRNSMGPQKAIRYLGVCSHSFSKIWTTSICLSWSHAACAAKASCVQCAANTIINGSVNETTEYIVADLPDGCSSRVTHDNRGSYTARLGKFSIPVLDVLDILWRTCRKALPRHGQVYRLEKESHGDLVDDHEQLCQITAGVWHRRIWFFLCRSRD